MKKILTNFILSYLRFFARIALVINKPKVIGITGSVGKSSSRNCIYAILKDHYPTKMLDKGNSETGIPLGILGLSMIDYSFFDWLRVLILSPAGIFYLHGYQYLVIEMGIDEPDPPKNMEYLLTIVKPHIAVILNIHPVHTMQFDKTVKESDLNTADRLDRILTNIAKEKGKIITKSGSKVNIYNNENQYIRKVIVDFKATKKNQTLLSFGLNNDNEIYFADYQITRNGTSFTFCKKTEELKVTINHYLLPKEYQEILAAVILVGQAVGLTTVQTIESIERNFYLPEGRASLFYGIRDSIIIDSSYNASKAAVMAFLTMANEIKIKEKRPLIFCFGDMKELGEESAQEHTEVAKRITETVDYLYCVGDLTKKYMMGNIAGLKGIKWFENSFLLGKYLEENLPNSALVLVKGSQNNIFLEEAIKPILVDKNDVLKLCRQEDYWLRKKIKA